MSTRLLGLRNLRVAGFAVAAVAVAAAAVVITASAAGMTFGFRPSSTTPGADVTALQARSASAACQDFVQHFATEIGKSQAEVNAAFQKAIADTLADEMKSGKLTQAQADAIKQRLANRPPCAAAGAIGRGGERTGALRRYLQQYLRAAASALGVSDAHLKTDLEAGQTLSQVAAAQHVSEAVFRTNLVASLKPILDQAVTAKKISPAQEQTVLTRLRTGTLPLWDRPLPRRNTPAPSATPSTSTT